MNSLFKFTNQVGGCFPSQLQCNLICLHKLDDIFPGNQRFLDKHMYHSYRISVLWEIIEMAVCECGHQRHFLKQIQHF